MAEPQPAELTTTASTRASSNAAIVCRANPAASAARPLCSDSAPQQPCLRGTTTSQPSAASTRTVASFTPGKNTCCTQPVSRPTTARRGPCAGIRRASAPRCPRGGEGATRSDATSSGAYRAASWLRSIRPITPVRWAARSGRVSSRSRRGYGNVAKIAARATRARSVRGGRGGGRAGRRLLGPAPRGLDEPVIVHPRRAGGHAGHAAEAAVQVGGGGLAGHCLASHGPVEDLGHQVDPPAR